MRHFINILLLTLCFGLTSCIYDKGIDFGPEHGADGYTFVFTLKVDGATSPSRADYATWGDTYDTDVTNYDAVINTDDIHVAIFDTKGTKVVDVDKQMSCVQISPGTYQYCGIVDKQLTDGEKYRCMVVANSGGETVDFDNIETLTYKAADLPQADDTKDYFIPMWGVQEFTFEKGKVDQDLGTIFMLHSAVKCRVHLSDELTTASPDLKLKEVKLNYQTSMGYVVPAGYNTVADTKSLSLTDCFNPVSVDAENGVTQSFISENDKSTSAVGYFAEFSTGGTNVANLVITVASDKGESQYTVAFQIEDNPNLTRNYVYDVEITSVVHGLTITMSSYWVYSSYRADFTDQISIEDGIDPISWLNSTYGNIDTTNKTVTLKKGVELIAQIPLIAPQQCTWLATLTPTDDEDTTNAIVFSDGTTYTSGTIDGVNKVTLRIKASTDENSIQHKSLLTVYVRFANGQTAVVTAVDGWTIVQTK